MCNAFTFQVSNCLWTLDVIVLVIDMKHAEKNDDGEYCCCDEKGPMKCKDSLSDLGMCEERKCDVVLNVTVSPCTESSSLWPCSVSTLVVEDAENLSNYGYIFHFTTSAQANKVRYTYTLYTTHVVWLHV